MDLQITLYELNENDVFIEDLIKYWGLLSVFRWLAGKNNVV